jgi:hypothetical protein
MNVAGGFVKEGRRGVSDSVIDLGNSKWSREGSARTENENDFIDHEDHVSVYEDEDSEEAVITQHGFNGHEGGQHEESYPSWSQMEYIDPS